MDSITSLFSTLGDTSNPLTKILPLVLAGTGVAGTVGNIQGNNARNAVLKQQMDLTKQYANLTPAQIASMVQGLEVPLSKDLTNSVGNTVQGQLAERGLSQAPGIYASSLAQGLAPYQLQEQQLAQDALFKKLGLPISARPSPFGPFPQQTNTTAIWSQLLKGFMNPNQVPGGVPPSVPGGDNTPDLIQQMLATQSGLVPPPPTAGSGTDSNVGI